ncbi:hypothetical protein SAMN04488056_12319 [Cohaesibacter marisflavi]|uniref:Uncharacterized protein n=1 Tax=Cohaesibacter marisflavi TaxID=655353 RepID=A0A1I5MSS7_9HYPH|nr:hypothetical protein [Cohaesibacter marisflavi]SFP12628.1 hypothetical protein SAMN04488056_12319 [Cohaesibacter marisflavi]
MAKTFEPSWALGKSLLGMRLIVSEDAVDGSKIIGRRFKPSPHRSKRIHKKLCKSFGGEFIYAPAIYMHRPSETIFIHPTMERELKRALAEQAEHSIFDMMRVGRENG